MQSTLESAAQQLCEVLAKPLDGKIVEIILKQPFKAERFAWNTAKVFDAQLRHMKGLAKHIATVRLMHPEQVEHKKLHKLSKGVGTWMEIKHVKAGRRILVLCLPNKLYVAQGG